MRRLTVLLLLLALPVQFAWATVGAYLPHEGKAAQWHAVDHVHEAHADAPAPGEPVAHADCADCHHATPSLPAHASASFLPLRRNGLACFGPPCSLNDVSSQPEKPNWSAAG